MSKLEILTGKAHLSYSAVDNLATCGERYRLERIVQVPQEPAWWFIGGSAIHRATESIDRGEFSDPEAAWQEAWNLQIEEDVPDGDLSRVRSGGRATKEWPNRENKEWWEHHGPKMVEAYRDKMIELARKGWNLWEPVADQWAVELPFEVEIGGVLVKGAVDRVYVDPDGQLVVVDLKAGSRKPESTMQLGVYAVALEKIFGTKPALGSYFMARKAELTDPMSLLHYTENVIGSIFATGKRMIEAEIFLPHVSGLCNSCGVSKHCTVYSALQFD